MLQVVLAVGLVVAAGEAEELPATRAAKAQTQAAIGGSVTCTGLGMVAGGVLGIGVGVVTGVIVYQNAAGLGPEVQAGLLAGVAAPVATAVAGGVVTAIGAWLLFDAQETTEQALREVGGPSPRRRTKADERRDRRRAKKLREELRNEAREKAGWKTRDEDEDDGVGRRIIDVD